PPAVSRPAHARGYHTHGRAPVRRRDSAPAPAGSAAGPHHRNRRSTAFFSSGAFYSQPSPNMPCQVTIKPSNHQYTAEDGETILDAALREGYNIPYGCRDGACGSCKGKLLEGRVDYGSHQESTLTDAEKKNGYALFCQARPLSDVTI